MSRFDDGSDTTVDAWVAKGRSARVTQVVRLLRDLVLRQRRLEPGDVLEQALGRQHQEVVAELRVLKVDLEQLFVGDGQDLAVLDAFDRRRSPVVGGEKAEFAHQAPRWNLDADFGD